MLERRDQVERIVTDDLLRAEADRDQNVYLGPLFTRFLSNALPDVVFLPASLAEVEATLAWARDTATPETSQSMEAPIASDKVTGNRSSIRPVTLCWYWKE